MKSCVLSNLQGFLRRKCTCAETSLAFRSSVRAQIMRTFLARLDLVQGVVRTSAVYDGAPFILHTGRFAEALGEELEECHYERFTPLVVRYRHSATR